MREPESFGETPQRGLALLVKRSFDVCLAGVLLLISSPLLLGAMAAIGWTMGRPIFFRQVRPGRHARLFSVLKLRTMDERTGPDGELLPPTERLTKVGRILRAASLDELPQLVNVIRGDMSLVGPRPLLVEYLPRYRPRHRRRHDVLPGITGLAQVNGRNMVSFDRRFDLDVFYVENWSLMLDLKILVLTFWRVIRREGVATPSEEGRPVFPDAPETAAQPAAAAETSCDSVGRAAR